MLWVIEIVVNVLVNVCMMIDKVFELVEVVNRIGEVVILICVIVE